MQVLSRHKKTLRMVEKVKNLQDAADETNNGAKSISILAVLGRVVYYSAAAAL
jgi:hypothetical protein